MPDMQYEERETQLRPGDTVLFYSDGLVEAHNAQRDMFSFPRLRDLLAHHRAHDAGEVVDFLLEQLAGFTGPDWEQEDDITLVTLHRAAGVASLTSFAEDMRAGETTSQDGAEVKTLAEFSVPSEMGNERLAMQRVREALEPLNLPAKTLDNLGTAVAEATMNAMEHGNKYQPELPVTIRVEVSDDAVAVSITDEGDAPLDLAPEAPDLEKKLAGGQTPRGWGLFLIQNMVDDMQVVNDERGHTLRLLVYRLGESSRPEGADHGN
jgi:anti-sigma regulatory factor (Ser/Thr protein kinase)